jgi:hypothetical protein
MDRHDGKVEAVGDRQRLVEQSAQTSRIGRDFGVHFYNSLGIGLQTHTMRFGSDQCKTILRTLCTVISLSPADLFWHRRRVTDTEAMEDRS